MKFCHEMTLENLSTALQTLYTFLPLFWWCCDTMQADQTRMYHRVSSRYDTRNMRDFDGGL